MSHRDMDYGWRLYFSSLPSCTPRKIEAESHMKRLASEESRIFSGQGDIEMWQRGAQGAGI